MYVEGFVCAVPVANKERYTADAKFAADIFIEHGASRVTECWGDDLPLGELNSFHTATMRKDDETVVFAWIEYADKATRDRVHAKCEADPRFKEEFSQIHSFDGKRMIFGGFVPIVDLRRPEG